jgi:adenylosuccinate synthase
MKRKINTIVDGQYGSTGKGSIAAYIALRDKPDTIITAWSPNAGHTAIVDGVKYVHTMLANGIVSPNLERILIGPGSVVNLPALLSEFEEAKKSLPHLGNVGILFHPNAVIVDQKHRDQEAKTMGAIGSTKKGSGAALIEKLMRNPESKIIAKDFGKEIEDMHRNFIVTNQTHYAACLATTRSCLIEGAQGFSLGINSGFYPYTTSRECTPQQLMIDCQLPRNWLAEMRVIMTMRTYPIRVNNAQGYSGPCYNDQEEIEFKDIPCPPAEVERTTVTKLPRRVFTYSGDQIHSASRIIRPDEVFLNFMNYVGTEWNKETSAFAEKVNDDLATGAVCYVGWGPEVTDIEGM